MEQLSDRQHGTRCLFWSLQNDRTACAKRGRDFPDRLIEGKIPRGEGCADSDRLT
jgi:hypothetical protein